MDAINEYCYELLRTPRIDSISEENKLPTYTLALANETGEVIKSLKKYIRDGSLDKEALVAELGDVLAYLLLIVNDFGYTLEDIAEINLSKLPKRETNGSGNDR